MQTRKTLGRVKLPVSCAYVGISNTRRRIEMALFLNILMYIHAVQWLWRLKYTFCKSEWL